MRNYIYKNLNKLGVGIDVLSLDIQRGRDHGVPPYYQYMEFCQKDIGKIRDWDDLLPNILAEVTIFRLH